MINWTAADNKTFFSWTVEKDFVLDGYPYSYSEARSNSGAYTFESEFYLSVMQGVAACVDNIHWNTFSVDPTLALLFTADPTIPMAPSKRVPTVAIVVPVVLVCVIVAVIILLILFVAPVRYFFLPYRRRAEVGSTELPTRKSTWNNAEKPSI